MNTARPRHVLIGVSIAIALASLITSMLARDAAPRTDDPRSLVDLTAFDRSPVHTPGRLKSYGSFARDIAADITDGKGIEDELGNTIPSDRFTLDLTFRPAAYADRPLFFVKNINMRRELAAALEGDTSDQTGNSPFAAANTPVATDEQIDDLINRGRISATFLNHPRVLALRSAWQRDLLRTAKPAQALERAMAIANPATLRHALKLIPPPSGDTDAGWISIADLTTDGPSPADALTPAQRAGLTDAWLALAAAWRNPEPDPATIQQSLADFTAEAAAVAPALMPDQTRMLAEAWYFDLEHLTWVWILYLLASFFFLLAVVYRFAASRGIAFGIYAVALALHTTSIGWRWWVSGRWPNSNMYEAVTTAFWFGAVTALVLEFAARKSPLKGIFALGASISGMVAMMTAAYSSRLNLFFDLDPAIRNMMPVLHDLWLYIHTNVIIASYALIFAAGCCSAIYLVHRALGGAKDHAGASGTRMLLTLSGADAAKLSPRKSSLPAVLDGATMILIEMSFVLLWAGIIMGAIWADHSWGRPWGWDPKEVFALNTFLVYLVLIHARIVSRDKGFWTAVLSVIGALVMIFNWLVINFVIAGLHSYA